MIVPPVEYHAPATVAEALEILAAHGPEAAPLAGGTDLVLALKTGTASARRLVSLRRLEPLGVLAADGGEVRVGATVTVARLGRWEEIVRLPALGDAVRQMASPQVRARATVGGNLCTAAACADLPPPLLIAGARVGLRGPRGTREVPLAAYITGVRRTARAPDELLEWVACDAAAPGSAYVKMGVRAAVNIAVVGAAARVELEDGRVARLAVATTAASPVPTFHDEAALGVAGEPAGEATWRAVAAAVAADLDPLDDLRGSAGYRRHLGEVAVRRALELAARRWEEAARG